MAINTKELVVKFNKAVEKDIIDNNKELAIGANKLTITQAGASAADLNGSKATLSEDGKTLTITLAAELKNNEKYVVKLAEKAIKVVNKDKNEYIEAFTSSVIEVSDKVAPVIVSTEKLNSTQVKVKFSEPLQSLGTVSAKLTDGTSVATTGNGVTHDFAIGSSEVTFTLGTDVRANKDVAISLVGTKDFADNLINPNPVTFTVKKGELDGTAPTISSLTVLTPEKIELKFSEEVQKFPVTSVSVNGTALTAADKVEQDKTDKSKFVITLASSLSKGFHTIAIPNAVGSEITDLSGEKMASFSKLVEVKEDSVAPKLTSSKVVKDSKDGKEYLVVKFDKDVQLDKLNLANLKTGGLNAKKVKDFVTTTVNVKVGSDAANKGFVPVEDGVKNEYKIALAELAEGGNALTENAKYTLDLPTSAVKNLTGKASEAQSAAITFTRGSDSLVDNQEVSVVVTKSSTTDSGVAPADTTLGNNKVVVKFKQNVDGATATNPANYQVDNATVKSAELDADKKTVTLTLEEGKTTFTGDRYITINGVKTSDGVAMKEAFKKVITLSENIVPTVTNVVVTEKVDAADPATTTTVKAKLTFSEAITNADAADFAVLVDGTEDAGVTATTQIISNEAKELVVTLVFDDKAKFSKAISLVEAKDASNVSKLNIQDAAGNKLDIKGKIVIK